MVTPRITRKFLIAMKIQNILENYGLYNALLAVCILGSICLDTFIAWRGYMFNATSEDDQYSTLIYFFGLVGYFMVSAVLGDIFFDRPHNRPAMGIFDGLVISILHFFLLICYFFYWVTLPADVWNPCQYYMPDFYWVSFRITPLLLFCQTVLSGSCAFVIYRKR
ncbi:hypothetical protein CRE_21210 [Caenorhabditis remanei]|uniref:Uncharacterized protein n=1 Tax=Caenorhabditis remanei TaxID=31234 RepID=E3MEV6_CAERE|nr:hypothetical protein CRE_21210 [Caenorhabditis remanei]